MAKTFTKLTRPAMRKLQPGQTLVEHGITFERTSNGDGVFTVGIMVHGQRIHRVVGRESDGNYDFFVGHFKRKSKGIKIVVFSTIPCYAFKHLLKLDKNREN